MADYGVTPEGFILKRLADIREDLATALSAVSDPTTGETLTPNLDNEDDPLVQVVNALADALAVAWEHLQSAYNQFDPLKADGAGLSGVVQLNGIVRKPGIFSTVVLTVYGTEGTVIPAGSRVAKSDGSDLFITTGTATISGGSATATAQAEVLGPVAATIGTLTRILSPLSGWSGVTNLVEASPGTLEETDTELRLRQQASTALPARSVIESIYAGVLDLDGVSYCRVYQNNTLTDPDARGIPAKSVAVIVVGGENAEIAETIFNRLPAGAGVHGTTTETVYDEMGTGYDIKFTRPTPVTVPVDIEATIIHPDLFPDDGEDRIKAAIVAFAESGASVLGIASGFDQNGYIPGESVYASELYLPVMSVPGIVITVLTVGDPAAASVAIAWDEIASITADDITVTVA